MLEPTFHPTITLNGDFKKEVTTVEGNVRATWVWSLDGKPPPDVDCVALSDSPAEKSEIAIPEEWSGLTVVKAMWTGVTVYCTVD